MPSSADAPDLSGLIELSRGPQLDLKPVVLRVQTDLFLAAPIRDRAALEAFASLATGLIPTVDADTALIVARKLGSCADTPESVLLRLAERSVETAEAVIGAHPRPPQALIDAARRTGLDVEAVLAARVASPTAVDRTEPEGRDDEAFDLRRRVADARKDAERAHALLADPTLAPADLAPLWLHAEPHQRDAIGRAVEATAGLRPCPPAPRDAAARLSELSAAQDVTGFVAALAAAVGLPKDFLTQAPDAATRYDLLTLALRAADLREPEAVYIFLTLNEAVARSVQRVFALVELYRSTSRAAARDLLSAILDVALPERTGAAEHRPYLAPDVAKPRHAGAAERPLARPNAVPQRARRNA